MKKLILISILVLSFISCYSQVVPLKSYDFPNGAYKQDLDLELPFLEGTWEGIANNKKYTFIFTIFPHHLYWFSSDDYYYQDVLVGKFKVTDLSTNQVLYDDTSVTNFDDYKILLLSIMLQNDFSFAFFDTQEKCYNQLEFKLTKSNNNTNTITYHDFEYDTYLYQLNNCPYANQQDIPMFLPTTPLTLTKQ